MNGRMKIVLFAALLCCAFAARAEKVEICYGYDCARQAEVEFNAVQMRELSRRFRKVRNAEDEREVVAETVGAFYRIAGTQSPIWQDHGGNEDDEEVVGRMDCIDHSSNTTAFLALMEKRRWLRFHEVSAPVQRGIFNAHWAARLVEKAGGEEYAIDSWFFDPGEPAVVFPLEAWRAGARPKIAQQAAP
jgi:hypothetical protein